MDKYDQAVAIVLGKANDEERAEVKIVLDVVADALRGFEQVAADIDRIATALEKLAVAHG